jgi:hypothetical protein
MTFVVFVFYGAFAASAREYVINRPNVMKGVKGLFAASFGFSVSGLRLRKGKETVCAKTEPDFLHNWIAALNAHNINVIMALYYDKLEHIPPLIVERFIACHVQLATNKRRTDYIAIGLRSNLAQPFTFREL